MKPVYVFVYGTLKRGYGNNALFHATSVDSDESLSSFVGDGTTVGDHFTMLTGGFPYVLKNGISHVKGEVWRVTDSMTLQNLDRLEGVAYDHYVRIETEIAMGDDVVTAYMYVASPKTEASLRDNKTYFSSRQVVPSDNNVLEWNPRGVVHDVNYKVA